MEALKWNYTLKLNGGRIKSESNPLKCNRESLARPSLSSWLVLPQVHLLSHVPMYCPLSIASPSQSRTDEFFLRHNECHWERNKRFIAPLGKEQTVNGMDLDLAIIVGLVMIAVVIVIFAALIFYRRRKWIQENKSSNLNALPPDVDPHPRKPETEKNAAPQISTGADIHGDRRPYSPRGQPEGMVSPCEPLVWNPRGQPEGMVTPCEPLVWNNSLVSGPGSIGGESQIEQDTTSNLRDEFDQYKDQNLEDLRSGVENTVNGFDGMMSQALTKALIDDDDKDVDRDELLWGGPEQQSGAEIEASALSEVMDWLKRNETASVEVKRAFMQTMLNKMVSSVRHGVLQPEDASRTIHEFAALLDLQLLSDLSVTTILVYGLRKKVLSGDLIEAFREFGDIEEAAIAPNQRGFGLVRFKTDKSVDRAMRKYKNSDIFVQDVAASVKVLKPSGTGTMNSVT